MVFNSLEFLIFFPIAFIFYWLLPHRNRWILLLIASYYFYGSWKIEYLILIVTSTIVDYWAGLRMSTLPNQKDRKPFLYLSLLVNLGFLVTFKYLDFVLSNVNRVDAVLGIASIPLTNLIIPVGISFYTFQTLSYSIDIYNGKLQPEKNLGRFALFVSFFPQLVAGPIERASNLLPELRKKVVFSYENLVFGSQQALWGLFKKVVIADRLSIVVNEVYNNPTSYDGWNLVIATVFFAFQIYCDFSGYSDIAIGISRMMGFSLMTNFRTPYFSTSIQEFWQRWHISLSTWFRDYVYIPLGGNRTVKWRWYYNLFITFFISGLWHGASWNFAIWGALHGGYLIMERLIRIESKSILVKPFSFLKVFILVNFAWIFFRANTTTDAFYIVSNLFKFSEYSWDQFSIAFAQTGHTPAVYAIDTFLCWVWIVFLVSSEMLFTCRIKYNQLPKALRILTPIAAIVTILVAGAYNNAVFIYFQF